MLAGSAAPRPPAFLVLEDGRTFRGRAFGAIGETFGEAAFVTAMSGYQETLTDPSYHRQVVIATAPHIGNTGWNDEDDESSRIWVAGYVIRDPARMPSSWRATRSLDAELEAQGIVGICEVDTRALTRHLRERGAMRVGVSSLGSDPEALRRKVLEQPEMAGAFLADQVSTAEAYVVPAHGEPRFRVVAVDLGIKSMTPHRMAERGIEVHVVPATATAEEIIARRPDGVFFSNGPGDPAATDGPVELVKATLRRTHPVLRHLLRQPAVRPGPRLRDLQAGVRAPRHQPAGDGPDHPEGGGHRAQPRIRRRRTADRRDAYAVRSGPGQPRRAERRRRGGAGTARRQGPDPRLLGAVPPRGGRRPPRRQLPLRSICRRDGDAPEPVEVRASTGSAHILGRAHRDAAAYRHLLDPGDRVRTDRHRAGLRVRLLRHPGVPGAARRGFPGDPGQLEPGDDHDRPRVRRRDLRRTDHPGVRRTGDRQGAAGRTAGDPRRPDGAQYRGRAARERGAGALRGRADRRLHRRDPARREPAAVQGGGRRADRDRRRACRGGPQPDLPLAGRGAGRCR